MAHIWDLQAWGPPRGYFPEPTKSILVVPPRNVAQSEELFWGIGIKVVMGHRYIGGLIGESEAEKRCLAGKVTGWAESVETHAGVSRKHPQSACAGLQKSLQQEWVFLQRVTPGIGNAFGPVEKVLRDTFVQALFEGLGEGAPERVVIRLPVKQAGLALLYPTLMAPENWTASCVITGHLIAELRGQVEFRTSDCSACLREGLTAVWRQSQHRAEEALAATIAESPVQGARRLKWETKTGSWLTFKLSTVNGNDMGAQEWCDALFLRYGLEPPDLPKY